MPNDGHKSAYTTVSIDRETGGLVAKICKRYALKKSEVVRLAFAYLDKAHINPADAPESVKSELLKIDKRQDDLIRFIRHFEEEQLNPMIRATHAIATRFDTIAQTLEATVLSQIRENQERHNAILERIAGKLSDHAGVINEQGRQQPEIGKLPRTRGYAAHGAWNPHRRIFRPNGRHHLQIADN